MEVSDDDEASMTDVGATTSKRKRPKLDVASSHSTETMMSLASDWIAASQIRDEKDVLKCQLEAYKNEVELLKQEAKNADDEKDKQINQLKMALQGMQQQLINSKKQQNKISEDQSKDKVKVKNPSTKLSDDDVEKLKSNDENDAIEILNDGPIDSGSDDGARTPLILLTVQTATQTSPAFDADSKVDAGAMNKDARLIALVSTFLHVHPFGANIDYIWSYLHRLDLKIRSSELEDLLENYPAIFGHDGSNHGGPSSSSAERRWKFVGYDSHNEPRQ